MLGHSAISITLDIYAHVLPDMQQDAATTMQGCWLRETCKVAASGWIVGLREGLVPRRRAARRRVRWAWMAARRPNGRMRIELSELLVERAG
jgi:hypothetical protein